MEAVKLSVSNFQDQINLFQLQVRQFGLASNLMSQEGYTPSEPSPADYCSKERYESEKDEWRRERKEFDG